MLNVSCLFKLLHIRSADASGIFIHKTLLPPTTASHKSTSLLVELFIWTCSFAFYFILCCSETCSEMPDGFCGRLTHYFIASIPFFCCLQKLHSVGSKTDLSFTSPDSLFNFYIRSLSLLHSHRFLHRRLF